jgi:pyruvate formate lyase activating enzyme
MVDTARMAKARTGSRIIWVSNGYINPAPLAAPCAGLLDAANVNLKSISDDTYRRLNGGRLKPIQDTFHHPETGKGFTWS